MFRRALVITVTLAKTFGSAVGLKGCSVLMGLPLARVRARAATRLMLCWHCTLAPRVRARPPQTAWGRVAGAAADARPPVGAALRGRLVLPEASVGAASQVPAGITRPWSRMGRELGRDTPDYTGTVGIHKADTHGPLAGRPLARAVEQAQPRGLVSRVAVVRPEAPPRQRGRGRRAHDGAARRSGELCGVPATWELWLCGPRRHP